MPDATGSPKMMRQINTRIVLSAIRERGPISRPDIARTTEISGPTVANVVKGLLKHGYVIETEFHPNGDSDHRRRGPKPKLLEFNSKMAYVIGIDTGADNTIAVLADLDGTVIARTRIELPPTPGRRDVVTSIRTATAAVIADSGVSPDRLRAFALGTPGVVDPDTGTVTLAPQIREWDGIQLEKELASLVPCPVIIENESHLALLAEQWIGGAAEFSDVIFVQLGVGIGGALLLDGRLYRGNRGAAGEIAYLRPALEPGAEEHLAPSVGAFEWYAGGYAYHRFGAEVARSPRGELLLELAGGDPEAVTAHTIFAAAARGDEAAHEIASTLLGRLGHGIANVACAMDPEIILIGGGISQAGALVRESIQHIVDDVVPGKPTVVLSDLGDDGAAMGAIKRALEVAEQSHLPLV